MQRNNKIFSIFFLSIFSMFMLHQALPDVHHQHDGSEDSVGQMEQQVHNHEKDHHHADETEDDFDFLDFLLGSHSHSIHAENIPTVKSNAKPFFMVKDIQVLALSVSQEFSITDSEPENTIFSQQPPDYFYNTYLLTSSLRGPPALG